MASAKKAKSRKTTKRSKAVLPSRKQRKLEKSSSPEEVLERLDAATEEHDREVQLLGISIFKVIEKANYHPTVVLDTLQVLLSSGIGTTLGDDQEELFRQHIRNFHEESRMLAVANMLGASLADLMVDPGDNPETPAPNSTPEAEGTELGGKNDYAQGT